MATRQIGFSSTTTVTLEPQSSSSSSSQPSQNVVLRLHVPRKKVTWKEGTVDNEFLNRKSSKKCCIFHKQKPFDEDDSDEEDDSDRNRDRDDSGGGGRKRGDLDGVGSSGCCHHGGVERRTN